MTRPDPGDVRDRLMSADLELPALGGGHTAERLRALCELSRRGPIGVARLAEAHVDAVAIMAEAGCAPAAGALYGVWASQHATHGVTFDPATCTIDGTIGFASGLGVVDRALVTARSGDATVLVDVDVDAGSRPTGSVAWDLAAWSTPALADTFTGPVSFDGVDVAGVVGEPGWYLSRPGFWHGACAPAACWAGGAIGLVDVATRAVDDDPHRRAHHGALLAQQWALEALLDSAGARIDGDPGSALAAERIARSLRFSVSTICRDVLDRFGRAFGPRPYTEDGAVARRAMDLDLYVKQHHAERELPAISALEATP